MKHLLFTFAAAAILGIAQAQIPSYVPTEGLVAWYPMNNSGDDGSGNGFHGEVVGSTFTTDRFGSEASSAYFDWAEVSGYGNPWHRIEINPGFDGYLEGTFSVAAWINPENYYWPQNSAHSAMIFGYASRCPNTSGLRFSIEGEGALRLRWGNNAISEEGAVALNEWQHVVGTISTDSMRVYINGIQVGAAPAIEGPTSGCFNIGELHQANGHWYYFDGAIDDLGVWNRALSIEEINELYAAPAPVLGCTDSLACNFDSLAVLDDESCVYSGCNDPSACNFNGADICDIDCIYPAIGEDCTAGESLCGLGTYWDDASQTCMVTIPGDVDFNGCLNVEDLLGTLAIYNLCFDAEAIAFTCGVDVVNYDGYDYQTVQIGDQCWFAENCKHLPEVSPGDTGSEDVALEPHAYVYGYNGTDVEEAKTFSDRYDTYGVLYNHFAAEAWQLCPSGWHKALAQDFRDLEVSLGLPEELVASGGGSNGTDIGIKLKAVGFGNGTNSSGFTFLGAGYREVSGNFHSLNYSGHMRAFAVDQSIPPNGSGIEMNAGWTGVGRMNTYVHKGFSVRCIKDTE